MKARLRVRRLVSSGVAIAAIAVVAWVVPLRDRCWDAGAPSSTRVTVTRGAEGCVLHLRTGDVAIGGTACAQLKCEPGVMSTFAHIRLGVLAPLLVLYGLGTLVWSARWKALLALAGVDLPLSQVWRISTEAQAGGVLLPGGLGGDALRIASVLARPTLAGEARGSASKVVASVLLDRAVGISLIAGVAATLGVASDGLRGTPLAPVLAAIPMVVVGGFLVLRHAPVQRIGWLGNGRVGRVARPVLAYVRDRRAPAAIAAAAGLSAVVALIQFGVIRGLVFALRATPATESWIYVGTAVAFLVSAIPALPGGWGTADAAYVFFFGLAGVGSGAALAVCLMFRLFWYLLAVVGAILYVARPPPTAEEGNRPDVSIPS